MNTEERDQNNVQQAFIIHNVRFHQEIYNLPITEVETALLKRRSFHTR